MRAVMDDTVLVALSADMPKRRERRGFTMSKYRLSNVGMLLGVISWEVRGYLSEIQRKNWDR
jgi:hypothetical protein